MANLSGPKRRIGTFTKDRVEFKVGQTRAPFASAVEIDIRRLPIVLYLVAMCTAFISPIVAEVFLIAAAGVLRLFGEVLAVLGCRGGRDSSPRRVGVPSIDRTPAHNP